MPVRFLTDAQREQLSGFPAELDAEALDRFFTFSDADLAEISRRHGDGNRLGWALQLSGLRLLGFCPADVTTAPAGAVTFVARQLGVNPGVLEGYGARAQTRTDHVNQVKAYLGFRSATATDLDRVRDWLGHEALAQDRPIVLFHLAGERMTRCRAVRKIGTKTSGRASRPRRRAGAGGRRRPWTPNRARKCKVAARRRATRTRPVA